MNRSVVTQIFNLSVALEIVPSRDDFLCERKRLFPKNFPVLNFPVSEIMLWLRLARAAPYRRVPLGWPPDHHPVQGPNARAPIIQGSPPPYAVSE
jgi:hypothetical protein